MGSVACFFRLTESETPSPPRHLHDPRTRPAWCQPAYQLHSDEADEQSRLPSCRTGHARQVCELRSRLHSRPLLSGHANGHNGKEAIQSILRSNIPNGPLASVSESAGRSVQRFYTLSFTEIFPSGPFTAKLFFRFYSTPAWNHVRTPYISLRNATAK